MQRADQSAAPAKALSPRPPTSPLTWWVLLVLALLGATFWLIVAGARRSARTEDRGFGLAAVLLREGQAIAPIDWDSEWVRQHLLARVVAAATAADVFANDLELLPQREPHAITLVNKHYCIELRASAPADPEAPVDGAPPLESMAWPREAVSPAHTVFFYPEDAPAAYSRNLQSAYHDRDSRARPGPGEGHRRDDGSQRIWDYRGIDGERWLLLDRPALLQD
ncbi:MAG: hypothetical protein AB7O97_15840 [Planctomycetota bacterium]